MGAGVGRLSGLLVAGVTAVALVAAPSVGATAPRAKPAVAVSLPKAVADSSCPDVVFVSASGAGEGNDATDVDGAGQAFAWAGARAGAARALMVAAVAPTRSYAFHDVTATGYAPAAVTSLVNPATGLAWTGGAYYTGVSAEVTTAQSYLTAQAAKCPSEQFVLEGYSQGAIALHRAVAAVAKTASAAILNRVAGVVLLGDGDRVKSSATATIVGNPPAPVTGTGCRSRSRSRRICRRWWRVGCGRCATPTIWCATSIRACRM